MGQGKGLGVLTCVSTLLMYTRYGLYSPSPMPCTRAEQHGDRGGRWGSGGARGRWRLSRHIGPRKERVELTEQTLSHSLPPPVPRAPCLCNLESPSVEQVVQCKVQLLLCTQTSRHQDGALLGGGEEATSAVCAATPSLCRGVLPHWTGKERRRWRGRGGEGEGGEDKLSWTARPRRRGRRV
jgi:hypothetical protein